MDRHPRSELSHKGRRRGPTGGPVARRRSSKELVVDVTTASLPSLEQSSSSSAARALHSSSRFKTTGGVGASVSSVTSLTSAIDDHPLLKELELDSLDGNGRGNSLDVDDGLTQDIEGRGAKLTSSSSSSSSRMRTQEPTLQSMSQQAFKRGEERATPTRERVKRKNSAAAAAAAPTHADAETNDMEKEIVRVKLQLANAKAEIQQLRHGTAQILDENTCLRTELVSARKAELDLKSRVSDLEDDNADLARRAAQLEEDNARLKQVRSATRLRSGRSETRPSLLSRSSSGTFEHLVSAVENMLGSEIDAERKGTDGGGGERQSWPSHHGDVPETIFAEHTKGDGAEEEDELNNLALENNRLREEAELLAAERDEMRERLDQIMSVEMSCGTAGESTQEEPEEATTSLRGLMTKMTSFRNAPQVNKRMSSVDSLLWDSWEGETSAAVSLKIDRLRSEGNRAA